MLEEVKEIILFVDGDRGGKLIARNVVDNARVKYITSAPDGKEVEELWGKEILMSLRKKVSPEEFFARNSRIPENAGDLEKNPKSKTENENSYFVREKLKEISNNNDGSGKAVLLDKNFKEIKNVSSRSLSSALKGIDKDIYAIVLDGTVTNSVIKGAEEKNTKIIVGKNFSATSSKIELLSL